MRYVTNGAGATPRIEVEGVLSSRKDRDWTREERHESRV